MMIHLTIDMRYVKCHFCSTAKKVTLTRPVQGKHSLKWIALVLTDEWLPTEVSQEKPCLFENILSCRHHALNAVIDN